jgi:TPR repeat protein
MAMINAQAGKAWAQTYIGQQLQTGRYVQQDTQAAIRWFAKAAEQDHLEAAYKLATAYYRGEGVQESRSKAWKFALRAARHGHAGAQSICAAITGIRGDDVVGMQWMTLSVAQGHPGAYYGLGQAFLREIPTTMIKPSLFKAHYWLKKSVRRAIRAGKVYRNMWSSTKERAPWTVFQQCFTSH